MTFVHLFISIETPSRYALRWCFESYCCRKCTVQITMTSHIIRRRKKIRRRKCVISKRNEFCSWHDFWNAESSDMTRSCRIIYIYCMHSSQEMKHVFLIPIKWRWGVKVLMFKCTLYLQLNMQLIYDQFQCEIKNSNKQKNPRRTMVKKLLHLSHTIYFIIVIMIYLRNVISILGNMIETKCLFFELFIECSHSVNGAHFLGNPFETTRKSLKCLSNHFFLRFILCDTFYNRCHIL